MHSGARFHPAAARRRVWIMCANKWMTLLLSNLLPSDHRSDLPPIEVSAGLCHYDIGKYACGSSGLWCHLLFAGITPARHPMDLEKSSRALGFPTLVMGLCLSYRVPVPPARSCHRDIGKYAHHSIDLWCHLLFAGITPARHPVDPEKSNRVLGFPALITCLCQFYGVPVAPNKVIRPPINRAFIKKYCAPQAGAGRDTTTAWGCPAAGNRCIAATSRAPQLMYKG